MSLKGDYRKDELYLMYANTHTLVYNIHMYACMYVHIHISATVTVAHSSNSECKFNDAQNLIVDATNPFIDANNQSIELLLMFR